MPRFRLRRRHPNGTRPERISPHTLFSRRITALTVFFVAVCLVYGGILVALQAKGNAYSIYIERPDVPDGYTVETVTVQAMRGEIYDRNGKVLVSNSYFYDLTLDYSAFLRVGSSRERNRLLLSLAQDLTETTAERPCDASFPLVGTYPELTYHDDALAESGSLATTLSRVLARNHLGEKTSAADLVAYYIDTYSLDAHIDGIPAYTSEQIDTLLRIYYDMDACDFGAAKGYTMASGVPSSFIAAQKEQATPCISFSVRTERVYHYPGYAAHILGRVGQIFAEDWAYYNAMGYPMNAIVGVSGCEAAFEHLLRGTDGEMQVTLDADGRVSSREVLTQPIAGQDIRLTIDIDAQIAAEDALRKAGCTGAVVAMDASTGEYIVLASAPTYDVSTFTQNYTTLSADPSLPLINRALSMSYPMGASAHLLTATAALSEGVITPDTTWTDSGISTVGETTLVCSQLKQNNQPHGTVDVVTALEDGCDVFFGQLGAALGNYRFSTWENALGIGQPTGIELSESEGQSANIYPGTDGQAAAAACGSSTARATPAQLCSMLSTVLTGGQRYQGHLLLDVRDFTSGEVVYRKQPELLSAVTVTGSNRISLLRALKNNVFSDTTLAGASMELRRLGLDVGMLPVAGENQSIALAYSGSAFLSADAGLSVAVVLDRADDTARAGAIGITVLNEWFR